MQTLNELMAENPILKAAVEKLPEPITDVSVEDQDHCALRDGEGNEWAAYPDWDEEPQLFIVS